MSRRVLLSFALAVALVGFDRAPVQAQGTPPDSMRARVQRQLERLSRAPGVDTLQFRADSLAADSARAARSSPGARPVFEGAQGDSILLALRALNGFVASDYAGKSATFSADSRVLVLQGDSTSPARVVREGVSVEADTSVTYDEARARLTATGRPVLDGPDMEPVNSRSLTYDLTEQRGSALGARTVATEGAPWIITGDITSAEPGLSHIQGGHFTSCELDEPHFYFEADELKVVSGSVMVARPVRLVFGDVPVLWLPFIAQSMSSGRASGLLTPRFSVNDIVQTSRGSRRRISNVGFFWAASDYFDATIATDWFSGQYFSVSGSGRYRILSQFLSGTVNYRQFWRENGRQELTFDTRHNWDISERTKLRVSARYASSSSFVQTNSFDPREVTQSINSDAGIDRRFDWGSLSVSADRRQFLSDDRVQMTLPSLNLSLKPITLFKESGSDAGVFDNITFQGSGNFRRQSDDRTLQPDQIASLSTSDRLTTSGSFNSSVTLGSLSLSQRVQYRENKLLDVPFDTITPGDSITAPEFAFREESERQLQWEFSTGYQIPLIGSSTLTPNISVSGSLRSNDALADSIPELASFLAEPTRITVGASLRTDIYGFFGGFGPFERIRHKISPGFTYSYSPATTPTELQRLAFNSRDLQEQNRITISLNQTFEAKYAEDEEPERPRDGPEVLPGGLGALVPDSTGIARDTLAFADSLGLIPQPTGGLRSSVTAAARPPAQRPPFTLLSIQSSAQTYDFVVADSTGRFIDGFTTTTMTNNLSSDYLRGMRIGMTHDLFDTQIDPETQESRRTFSPYLTRLNLGFSLSSQSALFRWLGLFSGGSSEDPSSLTDVPEEEQLQRPSGTDETSIVPGDFNAGGGEAFGSAQRFSSPGGWNASLSYSLLRSRNSTLSNRQMIQSTLTFRPTEHWDVSWRTSYDVGEAQFSDHIIRLSRNIHRWVANFDFLQTVTGNWTFRFEVSLLDNPDIQFDHEQRSIGSDSGRGPDSIGGGGR